MRLSASGAVNETGVRWNRLEDERARFVAPRSRMVRLKSQVGSVRALWDFGRDQLLEEKR